MGAGVSFDDAGEHELKGVPGRWRLYRVISRPGNGRALALAGLRSSRGGGYGRTAEGGRS